ncbi:MAG TPA: hypothetical protein VFI11_10325 [Anaerolineales bacterium]|nr:hypothetical protein [Anaerolineales bacterium]
MRSARQITLAGMGAIMAMAGFEHGLGEALQGNVAPGGLVIESWPHSEFYRSLAGEPAMTLIPNLLVSGVLTMLLSLALLVWMLRFVGRPDSALIIAALSIPLLLVGGGFGPPVLGLILAAATKVNSPSTRWHSKLPRGARQVLAASWPILFASCIMAWLLMLLGLPALGYFSVLESDAVVLGVLVLAFFLLALALFSSFARDVESGAIRTDAGLAW